jgi:hypothetical protein
LFARAFLFRNEAAFGASVTEEFTNVTDDYQSVRPLGSDTKISSPSITSREAYFAESSASYFSSK